MLLAMTESQQLLLNDDKDTYNEIWKNILSTVYQRFKFQSKLLTESQVWSNEMNTITLLTPNQEIDNIKLNDSIQVKFIKHPILKDHYRLNVIPRSGYNLISFGTESLQFYAQDPIDWPLIRRQEIQEEIDLVDTDQIMTTYSQTNSLSPWYGIVLMLLGFGALWLDERLYS